VKLGSTQGGAIPLTDSESEEESGPRGGRFDERLNGRGGAVLGSSSVLYVTEAMYQLVTSAAESAKGPFITSAFASSGTAGNWAEEKCPLALVAVPPNGDGSVGGERASCWAVVMGGEEFIGRLMQCQLEAIEVCTGQGPEAVTGPLEDEHIQTAVGLFVSSLPLPEEKTLHGSCTSAQTKVCIVENCARAITRLNEEMGARQLGGLMGENTAGPGKESKELFEKLDTLQYYGARGGVLNALYSAWVAWMVVQHEWSVMAMNKKQSKRFLTHLTEACFYVEK
jgi:hypothetical protein